MVATRKWDWWCPYTDGWAWVAQMVEERKEEAKEEALQGWVPSWMVLEVDKVEQEEEEVPKCLQWEKVWKGHPIHFS